MDSIIGTVFDDSGSPLANQTVELWPATLPPTTTGPVGDYSFGPGLSGTHCAVLVSAGKVLDHGCAALNGLSGDVTIDLHMPADG
jgi:hypothetical protein